MRTKLWVILSDGCWWRDEELNYSTLTLICVICFKGWFWFSRLIQGVQRWNLTGHGWVKQHFLDLSDFFFLCFFAWNTEYFHVSRLLNSSVDMNFAFFISTETVWGSSAGGCNPEKFRFSRLCLGEFGFFSWNLGYSKDQNCLHSNRSPLHDPRSTTNSIMCHLHTCCWWFSVSLYFLHL